MVHTGFKSEGPLRLLSRSVVLLALEDDPFHCTLPFERHPPRLFPFVSYNPVSVEQQLSNSTNNVATQVTVLTCFELCSIRILCFLPNEQRLESENPLPFIPYESQLRPCSSSSSKWAICLRIGWLLPTRST